MADHCDPGAAGADSRGARFFVFDGTRPDAPEAGFFERLRDVVPHDVKVAGPRAAGAAVTEIAGEMDRRDREDEEDAPPWYVIVYNLSRFRDLRKDEDDFGYSRLDEDRPPSPGKQFARILRDGPPLGIHGLLWCDTYNNVHRSLDRQGLRDLEMRILFQMNAGDSSNLIDTPAASQLGIHRAILYNEGLGHSEKFRPYGLPPAEWLRRVKEQFERRPSGPGGPLAE